MRIVIALLVLGTLAGCSTKYDLSGAGWTKPGALFQDTTYDEIECVRAARAAGHTPDLVVGGLVDLGRSFVEERQRSGEYHSCMHARGYQPSGS